VIWVVYVLFLAGAFTGGAAWLRALWMRHQE
jgi:hypothetical protein